MYQIPLFRPEWLDLSDADLGRKLLGNFIEAQAYADGLDPKGITQEYAERIMAISQQLPDDHSTPENDSLLLAIRLSARGNFESAGKKLRAFMKTQSEVLALKDMLSNLTDDQKRGIKVRRSAKRGHEMIHGDEVTKEEKRESYRLLLAEIRKENPGLSNNRVYQIASSMAPERLNEVVSYKAFDRLEKRDRNK